MRPGGRQQHNFTGRTAAPDEPYDPLQAGSIDGTDTEPHDHGILRALDAHYDPHQDQAIKGSARRTLFIGRLSFATDEDTLRSAFERYGKIMSMRLVRDLGKSRGYAFIEYKHERDALEAYRDMHGREIDQARILVDRERERTMKGWVPRRLGGGFGGKKESGQLRFGGRDRPWRQPIRSQHMPQKSVRANTERTMERSEHQRFKREADDDRSDARHRDVRTKRRRYDEDYDRQRY